MHYNEPVVDETAANFKFLSVNETEKIIEGRHYLETFYQPIVLLFKKNIETFISIQNSLAIVEFGDGLFISSIHNDQSPYPRTSNLPREILICIIMCRRVHSF